MKYKFPIIRNISDVLPHIENNPAFIVAKKDDYTVINYVNAVAAFEDTTNPKADAIRRECRGLIFDNETGKLLSRRLHKFFNVGERPETSSGSVDMFAPHTILEKLDGSMIAPFFVNGGLRWGTKMGITETSMQAEQFVCTKPNYLNFAKHCLDTGATPIFEWCSLQNRIVITHEEPKLVLLAIRDNETGEYTSYNALRLLGLTAGIPVVTAYKPVLSLQQLVDRIRKIEDGEGVIVRFNDGHMVKIKSDWYVRIHRIKDMVSKEKNLVDAILHDQIDDALPILPEYDQNRVKNYAFKMMDNIHLWSFLLTDKVMKAKEQYPTRAEFAINFANQEDTKYRAIIYKIYDGVDARTFIMSLIQKNLSNLESVRFLLGASEGEWNGKH